jgi:hypothetical protein
MNMKTYSIRVTVEVESNMDNDARKCEIMLTSVGGYISSVAEAVGDLTHEIVDSLYSNLRDDKDTA